MTTMLPKRQLEGWEDQIQSQLSSFGVRLRELRRQRGWTLQELAARSGLSRGFLSRLEAGGRQASIAAVLTLANVFEVSLASLFEPRPTVDPCVIVRQAEMVQKSSNGLKYAPLSHADRFFNLRPIKVTVPASRKGSEHFHHEGEEWIYVLAGGLTLSLAGKTYDLEPGDAAHFDSQQPHRLIARGGKDAEVLLVASPVARAGQPVMAAANEHRAIAPVQLLNFQPKTGTEAKRAAESRLGKIENLKIKNQTKRRKELL